MDPIDEKELQRLLERACAEAEDTDFHTVYTVGSKLENLIDKSTDSHQALHDAFEYILSTSEERKGQYGPFGPFFEDARGIYPIPPDRRESGVLNLWEQALNKAPLPLVRARFADLLWVARYGSKPHEFAFRAAEEYLAVRSSGYYERSELRDFLQRALEIATQLRNDELVDAAISEMISLAEEALESETPLAGISLGMIDALAKLKPAKRPAEINSLLDRAIETYGSDARLLESCLEIRLRLVSQQERKAIGQQMVEAYANLARSSSGPLKFAHLQYAVELADRHGLRLLAETLRREIQDIPEDELGFENVKAEIEIPRQDIDEFIDYFVGTDDIESALRRFGEYNPTGNFEENLKNVRKMMEDNPATSIFRRMITGANNTLVRSIDDPVAHEEQALIDHETHHASFFAQFAPEIIARIGERYGNLSSVSYWFETDFIEQSVAQRIGKALEHHENGDYDSAASVLAPRLERIVRNMASTIGITTTRSPDRGGRPGGVKTLGDLLALLEGRMPEDTRRYLRVLLSEVTGLNIRNRVGHGLVESVPKHEAALLIHAACHLQGFGLPQGPQES